MNRPLFCRCVRLAAVQVLAVLLLVAGRVPSARSQTTNAISPSTNIVGDVSQFPALDQLPGKVPPQVWTGLAQVWSRDHARWKATTTNDVGAVVFLGDSITEGWSTLARDFPDLKVADRGIGGDITSGVLYRLQADVLDLKPAAIVLLIGTNDIGDGADPADVAENMKQILMAINRFNPKLPVIVCKMMPRSERGQPVFADKIRKLNASVEEFVKTEPTFAICDTWTIYADETGSPNPADFRPDHLHLNAAGYAVWKTALDPILAKLNLTSTKPQ